MQLNTFFIFTIVSFFILPFSYGQDTKSISGQVVDINSNEPIVGANVYTEDFKYGTSTDEYGRFSIKVSDEYKTLIASYIGYAPYTCTLSTSGCVFELSPLELTEVVVKGSSKSPQKDLGHFSPSMEQVQSLPTLLGDVDIIKSMTLLPGISGGVEGGSGMLVRGGNLSHNLILLDGTPVYNSTHAFGFMSSFNPNAVKHVELYKGGFPAEYGGRLASVLNVTMKDGNMRDYKTNLSVGLVNSSLVTEGPIWKDRISYMVASRLMNLSALLALGRSDETASYWVYDLNAKMKFKITKKQSVYASFFRGQDNFGIQEGNDSSRKEKWGNMVGSLRYNNQLSNSLFFDAGVYFNRYSYQFGVDYNTGLSETGFYTSNSSILDKSVKLKAKWVVSPQYKMNFGFEHSQKGFTPVNFERELKDSNNLVLDYDQSMDHLETSDNVLFMGNEFSVFNKLDVYFGARAIAYSSEAYDYEDIDFRASMSLSLGQGKKIKLAYDEMNQPFHLLTTVGNSSPNEIWIPGLSNIPPSNAQQYSLGYSMPIPRWKSRFSVEVYTKKMKNLVRYKPGAYYLFSDKNEWRDDVIGSGDGTAMGIEFFLNKTEGRFTGWFGYTLSKSLRKYDEANNANWFAANYDRRHDIELTTNFKISKKWDISNTFIYQSGRPLTLPVAYYLVPTEPGGVVNRFNVVFDEINANRTSTYHRLDISATRKHKTKRGRDASWTFGVYNAYARNNPFSFDLSIKDSENNQDVDPSIVLWQKSLFNLIPSFNYKIQF